MTSEHDHRANSTNGTMRPIHERMPVILPRRGEKQWLPTGGTTIFLPFPSELMLAYPVTPKMNRASFNGPKAVAPLLTVID